MNISFVYNFIKVAKITAILSIIAGIFILIAHFCMPKLIDIVTIGMYYGLIVVVVNSLLFFALYIVLFYSKVRSKNIFKSLLILLINVPLRLSCIGVIISYHIP
ncbi:MAG: hypothetical protein AAF617_12820 [Bacteroidota bacterium]